MPGPCSTGKRERGRRGAPSIRITNPLPCPPAARRARKVQTAAKLQVILRDLLHLRHETIGLLLLTLNLVRCPRVRLRRRTRHGGIGGLGQTVCA